MSPVGVSDLSCKCLHETLLFRIVRTWICHSNVLTYNDAFPNMTCNSMQATTSSSYKHVDWAEPPRSSSIYMKSVQEHPSTNEISSSLWSFYFVVFFSSFNFCLHRIASIWCIISFIQFLRLSASHRFGNFRVRWLRIINIQRYYYLVFWVWSASDKDVTCLER